MAVAKLACGGELMAGMAVAKMAPQHNACISSGNNQAAFYAEQRAEKYFCGVSKNNLGRQRRK